ncbi:MAG: FecCD family ABC transporter permease [Colwellia sp.]
MTKNKRIMLVMLLFTFLSVVAALNFGAVSIDMSEVLLCLKHSCSSETSNVVIWEIRLPRILVALVAGMGLAIAGAILQNTTGNPLADPYLFGIVAGAGLGASVANLSFVGNLSLTLPLAAFLGALFSVLIVIVIAKAINRMEQLILVGVAVSFMLSALMQFILFLGEPFASNRIIFWMMGSFSQVELKHFYVIGLVLIAVLIVVVALHRHIDALLLGDDNARSLGIDANKLRLTMFALCAAITSIIVAYCGGIGFVGLMIPHIVRQFVGVTTLKLVLGCALVGGCFLIWVDVLARTLMPHVEIPLGIMTSTIGSIFFLFILIKSRNA